MNRDKIVHLEHTNNGFKQYFPPKLFFVKESKSKSNEVSNLFEKEKSILDKIYKTSNDKNTRSGKKLRKGSS